MNVGLFDADMIGLCVPASANMIVSHGLTLCTDQGPGVYTDTLLDLMMEDGQLELNHYGGDKGALMLANYLTNNSQLTSAIIQGSRLSDEGAMAIANAVRLNSTLEGLDMSNNNITNRGWCAVWLVICENASLQALDLSNNDLFSSSSASHWSPSPNHGSMRPSLQVVSLSNTGLTDNALGTWADALFGILRLTTLDLSRNIISDNGVITMLQYFNRPGFVMSTLSLSDNSISERGAGLLCERLTSLEGPNHWCSLQRIMLGGNCIPDTFFSDCRLPALLATKFNLVRHLGHLLSLCKPIPPPADCSPTYRYPCWNNRQAPDEVKCYVSFVPQLAALRMVILLGEKGDVDSSKLWLRRSVADLANEKRPGCIFSALINLFSQAARIAGLQHNANAIGEISCGLLCLLDEVHISDTYLYKSAQELLNQFISHAVSLGWSLPTTECLEHYRLQFLQCKVRDVAIAICHKLHAALAALP